MTIQSVLDALLFWSDEGGVTAWFVDPRVLISAES
jgi:hypothetical protein